MSIFDKHLGKEQPLIINGEEFYLTPLTVEELPHFFNIMKSFSGAGEDAKPEDVFKNMNDDGLKSLTYIIGKTVDTAYVITEEELKKKKEGQEYKKEYLKDTPEIERKRFALKYWGELFGKIMEINSSRFKSTDDKKKEKLKEMIRQRQPKK